MPDAKTLMGWNQLEKLLYLVSLICAAS
jgi:hypothetical protein